MPTVPSGDATLHFDTLGDASAPPVLLIMGMGMCSDGWDTLPHKLAERYRVIVFDNRGTGRSTLGSRWFSIADLADDATLVLDALNVTKADVFGISMGGMIAQELVLRHPTRVKSVALGATFAEWYRGAKAGPSAVRDLLLALMGRVEPAQLGRLLASEETLRTSGRELRRMLKRGAVIHRGTAARQLFAVARHSTIARLKTIKTPTLVISGDDDRLVPVENSRRIAHAIPGARLIELRGVGHVFPFEREAETVAALRDLFDSNLA
jgi:pimeloyl-ACP methyl ester carboxylesterase